MNTEQIAKDLVSAGYAESYGATYSREGWEDGGYELYVGKIGNAYKSRQAIDLDNDSQLWALANFNRVNVQQRGALVRATSHDYESDWLDASIPDANKLAVKQVLTQIYGGSDEPK